MKPAELTSAATSATGLSTTLSLAFVSVSASARRGASATTVPAASFSEDAPDVASCLASGGEGGDSEETVVCDGVARGSSWTCDCSEGNSSGRSGPEFALSKGPRAHARLPLRSPRRQPERDGVGVSSTASPCTSNFPSGGEDTHSDVLDSASAGVETLNVSSVEDASGNPSNEAPALASVAARPPRHPRLPARIKRRARQAAPLTPRGLPDAAAKALASLPPFKPLSSTTEAAFAAVQGAQPIPPTHGDARGVLPFCTVMLGWWRQV